MFTKTDIERYFLAEKQAGLLFSVIGMVTIVLALLLFFMLKSPVARGAAIPLLVFGLLQGVAGFTVYKRSDADRIRNVYAYDMNPQELRQHELPRMEKVNRNFIIYRWAEVALTLTGIGLVLWSRIDPSKSFWLGFGIALLLQAVLLFTADTLAEKRAKYYTAKLSAFLSVSPR